MAGTFLRSHTCAPIVVGGSSAFNIDHVDPQNVDHNTKLVLEYGAGEVDPTYIAAMSAEPMITFSTVDMKVALDAGVWLSGFAIPQTTVYTTVDVYFVKIANQGTRSGASSNLKCRVTTGMIIPKSITVSQGEPAKLSAEIWTIWDGSTAPIVYTDSVTVPHVPAVDLVFTLGQASINGTVVDGLQSMTFDFGIDAERLFQSGEYYPSRVHVLKRKPTITLQTKDVVTLSQFGVTGTAQGATDTLVYLQKMDRLGHRVAAGTAEHIQLSIDDGMIRTSGAGGANDASHGSTIVIEPVYDGTNAIVAKNTAVAIT